MVLMDLDFLKTSKEDLAALIEIGKIIYNSRCMASWLKESESKDRN